MDLGLFLLFSPKNSFVLFFSFQKCIIISFSSGIVLFSFDFLQELCYSFLSVMNYIFLFSFFRNCLILSCPIRFCINIFSKFQYFFQDLPLAGASFLICGASDFICSLDSSSSVGGPDLERRNLPLPTGPCT